MELIEHLAAGQALSAQDTGKLLTALLTCASWLPNSLFCGMHAIDMACCMRTEQLSAMRLLKMADQHGYAERVGDDPACNMCRSFQYCPDCKCMVTKTAFCCDNSRVYREKCDSIK